MLGYGNEINLAMKEMLINYRQLHRNRTFTSEKIASSVMPPSLFFSLFLYEYRKQTK